MRRILPILWLFWLIGAQIAAAQAVNFAWDPHPQATQIEGFKLYQSKGPGGEVGPAVATFTPGTAVAGSIPQPGLGNFCWVLTAYLVEGSSTIESPHSNEVCEVIKPKPPKLNGAAVALLRTTWWVM